MLARGSRRLAGAWLPLVALLVPTAAPAEEWRIGSVRVVAAGEIDGAAAIGDDGHFNDSDYFTSELSRLRLRLTTALLFGDHVSLLGEVRSDDLDAPRVYALYLRVRPWETRSLDLQAGMIPPVFGAFARRTYANDNPLIGFPLGYQYLTAVSAQGLARSADDLARNRGWGASPRLPIRIGDSVSGLPLVDALRWDTGVQLAIGSRPFQLAVALTQGSPSHPVVRDDNDGRQLAARLAIQPGPGLVVGLSAARGAYLSDDVRDLLPDTAPQNDFDQSALGVDMEFSRGYWLLRAEGIWSAWETSVSEAPELTSSLEAWSVSVEGRYRFLPGLYAAARLDRLDFGRIEAGGRLFAWDAPVFRMEVGLGVKLRRNLLLKGAFQQNWRDLPAYSYPGAYSSGTPVRSDGIVATQLSFWF
jgi:hypothetical protein